MPGKLAIAMLFRVLLKGKASELYVVGEHDVKVSGVLLNEAFDVFKLGRYYLCIARSAVFNVNRHGRQTRLLHEEIACF